MRTRKAPNTGTFYAVFFSLKICFVQKRLKMSWQTRKCLIMAKTNNHFVISVDLGYLIGEKKQVKGDQCFSGLPD